MFPDEFDYYRAASVKEVLDLREEHAGAEVEVIAGGHSLIPTMKSGLSSPDVLIDISKIDELSGIVDHGDRISVGATNTYAEVVNSGRIQEASPAFAAATEAVGDVQVRNMGTVGGNLAHADPASDLPGAAIAANATIVVRGRDGEREIPAEDFFFGMYMTDLGPNELLARIELPAADDAVGAYAKKPSPSSGYAIVGVAAHLEVVDGTVASAGVGANGAMDQGVRLAPVEDALIGEPLNEETISAAASRATDDLDTTRMMEDLQASAEYRETLLKTYTERALQQADDEARTAVTAD